MGDSRDLEILVAKIQAQLSPGAEVLHDVRLPGRHSKRLRQIDVLVKQRIGQYEMLIVLDCKDYKKRVDVKGVEEFHGLLVDVGAHRGALISPAGFTEAAKTRATGLQIDLYSPVDTNPHKWQAKVSAPVVCDFRSAAIAFRVSSSAPKPFILPQDFFSAVVAHDKQQNPLCAPLEAALNKWDEGLYPIEVGFHENLSIFETPEVLVDNGYGELVEVTLTASLKVRQQLLFGSLPIIEMSGFHDALSGGVITNAFTIGIFDVRDVLENWQPIATEEDAPVPPLMRLQGLLGWGA